MLIRYEIKTHATPALYCILKFQIKKRTRVKRQKANLLSSVQ